MDYIEAFKAVFENREFHTFVQFQECLQRYMEDVGVIYVRGTSRKWKSVLKYDRIFYRCTKYKRRRSECRGIRRVYSRDTCCKSRFYVVRRNDCLVVSTFELEHNHPLNRLVYESHPTNRRLTISEMSDSRRLFEYNTPTSDIKQYFADVYGKFITTADVGNIRRKLKPALSKNLAKVLGDIAEKGFLRTVQDENNGYTHICFAQRTQVKLFRRFPHVVNVDATHGTNRHNLKLYQFLVTDGMGHGRPVMYGYVRSEKYASLRKLFEIFQDLMGEHITVKTFVMDKMAAQMRAARVVFGCDVLLCYFHVRDAVRKHTNSFHSRYLFHRMATADDEQEFNRDLGIISRTDKKFMNYLLCNWLYIKPKWALHAQGRVVHFGNRTNNRLENANGRLKKRTHPRDCLATAIQKIWAHSECLMREFEMQTTYGCDRRELVDVDLYVKNILYRMTTFASHLVQKHLNKRVPRLHFETIADSKLLVKHDGKCFVVDSLLGTCECIFYRSMWLPCIHILSVFRKHSFPYSRFPIHDRWLAEYNLPIRRLVGPKLQPLVASNFNRQYKALHHLLAKLHECSSRTAVACFNSIIAVTSKTVERAKADLPLSDFPIVISSGNKQPRWGKKIRMGLPCGYCGEPVQTDSYRCETDELIFHSDCIRTADIWECPFCGKQLQPPSPVPSTSADVPARQMTQLQTPSPIPSTSANVLARPKNTSRIPSITDVDLDMSPDNLPCASKPKKVRIDVICSDSSADIIQQNVRLDERDNEDFL